jgi:hypothetical protein
VVDLSFNTQKLGEMASTLTTEAATFHDHALPKVHKLGIPAYEFPIFGMGLAGSYEQMRSSAEQATRAMSQTVEAMGNALSTVAKYYQQMEEQQGTDFDTGAEKAKQTGTGKLQEKPHGRIHHG